MRVLLVGQVKGSLDEGMCNISRSLFGHLGKNPQVSVDAVSPSQAVSHSRRLARWSPDVVHYLHGPSPWSLMILRWLRLVCPDCRSVLSFTHPDLGRMGQMLLKVLTPDYALVQSSHWQRVLARAGIPAALIPLSGVDLARFHPVSADEKRALKQRLAFPVDQRIVLHVGHVKPNRNLKALIPLQRLPDVQVVVLGSTATRLDEPLLSRLLGAGVIVRVEYVPYVKEYYQAADCYVFPVVDPNGAIEIPLSVLEAMATNLPVVTTRFGGLPAFFSAKDGLHFTDHTASSDLGRVVGAVLDVHDVKTRDLVCGLSWQHVTTQLAGIYNDLVSG